MNILENFVVTYGTGNLSGYRVTYSAYGVIEWMMRTMRRETK